MPHKNRSAFMCSLEHRRQAPLSPTAFVLRFVRFIIGAGCLVAAALGVGMLGYHELEKMAWLDAFLNAAMILGGMGPVNALQSDAGKLFAGGYALFSGLIFLVVGGLIFTPFVHRLLHIFHFDAEDTDDKS